MKTSHRQEREQFNRLFKQEGIDRFEDRFNVLEAFLQTERHLTVHDLAALLRKSGHHLELDFIRNTLDLMCRFGFASKNRFDNGDERYEHLHLGQHHDHMICTKCGRIIEFKNERLESLQVKVASSHGFHMLQHKLEIYGICETCLKSRDREIPLSMAKAGEQLRIVDVEGGANSRMRLLTMGLRTGDTISVITNQNRGQLVVAVDYKRYVLGRGLAEKIRVRPLK